ncbi:MAG: pitrilysin family protein [Phycisphaerales bacterium]
MANHTTITAILGAALLAGPACADIPATPRDIRFPEVRFDPPTPAEYRVEIAGVPVYLAPSKELPLVDVRFTFKGGGYLDPANQVGLADLTASLMRTGGAGDLAPKDLDEELEFLAADVGVNAGATFTTAAMSSLSDNFDRSFELFMDVVRRPMFDADRFEVLRNQAIEGMRQRNDDGLQLLLREESFLVYGPDSVEAREPTLDAVQSITGDDLRTFHDRVFHPGNLIIAISGDFDRDSMIERLRTLLADWPRGLTSPDVPDNTHEPEPGVYYVNKDQTQGQVLIGGRSVKRDDPDAIPLRVMNDILGGAGFTSRITKRVRTDEGLAYTAGSALRNRVSYPGDFLAYYFSKVPSVALAGRTVYEEINKIRDHEVSTDELETVKSNIIETFPRTFESKVGTLAVFVDDEFTDRPAGFWESYRGKVDAVTPADVQRVARDHLHPDRMVMVIVGPWEGIAAGNTASEDDPARVATMHDIAGGKATEIPMRDPLTLEIPGQD